MSRRFWILLNAPHMTDTYIPPEGDRYGYVIAPNDNVKRGDTVYLWLNYDNCFYGWGTVAQTPAIIFEETPQVKRRRQSVLVDRVTGFQPRITARMMLADTRLRNLIPTGFDDLQAIPLRPGQASDLNDYIREHKLDAPQGSATIKWSYEDVSDITVQALLTFGKNTDEGQLVEAVRIPWFEILEIIARDSNEIYNIDPRKFEEIIAGAYEKAGYDEVILTPRSGDKGRDVVAVKHGIGSIRIFDQVKRYKISRPVTADDVRALAGVISMAPNVSKGIITTTSTFAPNLLDDPDIARWVPYRLELRPRDILLPWLESLRKR